MLGVNIFKSGTIQGVIDLCPYLLALLPLVKVLPVMYYLKLISIFFKNSPSSTFKDSNRLYLPKSEVYMQKELSLLAIIAFAYALYLIEPSTRSIELPLLNEIYPMINILILVIIYIWQTIFFKRTYNWLYLIALVIYV